MELSERNMNKDTTDNTLSSIEARRQGIVDIVNQIGEIHFATLRHYFPDVSDVTLRKDLQYLDKNNQLIRIHGGAKSLPMVMNFFQRTNLHQAEKSLIGEKAAKLVKPGNSIFIAAGSTCIELAKRLPSEPLYVVTDGLITALSCPYNLGIRIVIVGGEVDLNTRRISGQTTLRQLDDLHFNIAFLGTPGFHPDYGFSNLMDINAAIVQKIIEHSEKVVVLMDSSKVNYTCSPWNTPLKYVDTIISDDKLDVHLIENLRKAGHTVL